MGPAGMRDVAELCLQKSRYAAERLSAVPSLSLAFDRPTFKEFVVRVKGRSVDAADREGPTRKHFCRRAAGPWYPQLDDCLLVAVTEKRTKAEIDRLADALADG